MFKTLRITGFIILLGILGCGGSGTSPSTNATAGNQSPIAVSDTYSVDSNTTLSVLVNDRDPDGTTLNLVSVTQPANGSVEITGSQISLTIDNDYVGNDQFTYTISDANGATATAQVQLALDPASKRPVAVNDKQSSIENTVISIDVLSSRFLHQFRGTIYFLVRDDRWFLFIPRLFWYRSISSTTLSKWTVFKRKQIGTTL